MVRPHNYHPPRRHGTTEALHSQPFTLVKLNGRTVSYGARVVMRRRRRMVRGESDIHPVTPGVCVGVTRS